MQSSLSPGPGQVVAGVGLRVTALLAYRPGYPPWGDTATGQPREDSRSSASASYGGWAGVGRYV